MLNIILFLLGTAGNKRKRVQTAERHKVHKHANSRWKCWCVCVCVVSMRRVWQQHAQWAAAVRTCVHRLAAVFTGSNELELMSLYGGSERGCVFSPSHGRCGRLEATPMKEADITADFLPACLPACVRCNNKIIKSRCSLETTKWKQSQ